MKPTEIEFVYKVDMYEEGKITKSFLFTNEEDTHHFFMTKEYLDGLIQISYVMTTKSTEFYKRAVETSKEFGKARLETEDKED